MKGTRKTHAQKERERETKGEGINFGGGLKATREQRKRKNTALGKKALIRIREVTGERK